ncbi:MAG: hypothetical protein L3J30_11855 [Marinosulfonomonas sp.]|nr:hypothetical protein [Marinosulfonomonas sp.]
MNRSLIVVVLIAVLGAGYYFYSQGGSGVEATGEMIESATGAASDAAGAATDGMAGTFLTAEGYDAAKVAGMIDASSLDDSMKQGLKQALESAGGDPALLQDVLAQVKLALGM